MIFGTVTEDGVPMVQLTVAGEEWPAIIDTGFNGDLELPDALEGLLNARFRTRLRSLLAGGQTIEEDLFLVDFPFDGETVAAEATFAPGQEILIGTRLLEQYRLEIDFPARKIVLERQL